MTALADAASSELSARPAHPAKLLAVRIWLFTLAGFVLAMVIVGGATRLTGSGLSITEWQPILGTLPPVSDAAWQEAFEKYRHIPQYELVNRGMTLSEFKGIFWWEWTHRLLGRLTGAVFLLPFVYFLARRAIPKPFILRIAALFVLGGAQGALGWFMVMSGLSDRVSVSQYRLAAHLALATAIAAYAFWLGLTVRGRPARHGASASAGVRTAALLLPGLVYLQIVAGAFVAGLKAGYAASDWPLMNGEFVPAGLDAYSPWHLNLFENPLAAQFVHRVLAYLIAIYAVAFGIAIWRWDSLRLPAAVLFAAILAQIALGVATIVYGVPLPLALAHQANAMIVLALALWTVRRACVH